MSAQLKRPKLPLAALALAALVVSVSVGGCKCLRGPVNASPGLRWWLFSNFGAGKVCPEMLKQGMALKMQDMGPSVGRFFPNSCTVDVVDETQTITVNFGGTGYAYTPVTGRVGFSAQAAVQYRPDFYIADDDIYVWARVNRILRGPDFQLGFVQNPLAAGASALTPLGTVANLFGNQIVAGEVTRGFTVVQDWDTESNTFALGILQPPAKPHTPYDVSKDAVYTFANETVEVQHNQRDFLGPFEIVDGDQQLQVRMFLQGPAVDLLVVNRQIGDIWRDAYQTGQANSAPPGPILAGGVLQPNQELRTGYRLPPGQYYIVIDNTAQAGTTNPPITTPLNPLAPTARISTVVQLGEL
ncbi:MAG: hypothetical protein R3B72_30420 [Polyangiaceae bacterium]